MTRKVDLALVWARIQNFIITQFLLVSYLVAITLALAWPVPGRAVASVKVAGNVRLVQSINIIIVFFITGLVLKTDELLKALRQRLGVLYGLISILGITPCLGFGYRELPLTPPAFAAGLALFCTVPTTLGVGISLVRSCKGNEALALFLTVVTNIVAIFLMPFWLKALFSDDSLNLHVDVATMFVKLLITVLVPAVIGKALRDLVKPVEQFANRRRTALGIFSTANLAFIVWLVLSGARDVLLDQRFVDILYVILLAIAQHLIYLAFNFTVVWFVLRMPVPEAVAAGLMASQKSSPVAVTVISYITSDVSKQGLMAIPALVGQIFQVFIGSALVPIFSKAVKRWEGRQAGQAGLLLVGAGAGGAGEQESGAEAEAQGLNNGDDLAKPSSKGSAEPSEKEGLESRASSRGRDEEEGAWAGGAGGDEVDYGRGLPGAAAGATLVAQHGSRECLNETPSIR